MLLPAPVGARFGAISFAARGLLVLLGMVMCSLVAVAVAVVSVSVFVHTFLSFFLFFEVFFF